jgi:hypothetical protein
MFKKQDPYTFSRYCKLLNGETTIGSILLEYQVTKYDDVQLSDAMVNPSNNQVGQTKTEKYLLHCTQRINIYNANGNNIITNASQAGMKFENYPAMIQTDMSIEQGGTMPGFVLLDYSPQTVNTQIQSSGSIGDSAGVSTGTSKSNSVGSSISQTNSFGTSISVGDVMGTNVSASYEHSTTTSRENSQSQGSEASNSNGTDASNSASMSIKDWGAYAQVNPEAQSPSWTFGQEYPWDVIDCRYSNGSKNTLNTSQIQVVIPTVMSSRLYDGLSLYPPSELSVFGINFVMKAQWLVEIAPGQSASLSIDHQISYFSASHSLNTVTPATATTPATYAVAVYIDQNPTPISFEVSGIPSTLTTTLNIPLMGLVPIATQNKSAIIGFIPTKFLVMPIPASAGTPPTPFKIISTSNDLLIADTTNYPADCGAGAGFTSSPTSLAGNFAANCLSLQITLYFKVTDTVNDYNLYMKHWKKGNGGLILTFSINGIADAQMTQYVDAQEATGGETNLLTIALRNQNYDSVYYYDYLQLGLNSIQVTITPIDDTNYSDSGYEIRAVSVEQQ